MKGAVATASGTWVANYQEHDRSGQVHALVVPSLASRGIVAYRLRIFHKRRMHQQSHQARRLRFPDRWAPQAGAALRAVARRRPGSKAIVDIAQMDRAASAAIEYEKRTRQPRILRVPSPVQLRSGDRETEWMRTRLPQRGNDVPSGTVSEFRRRFVTCAQRRIGHCRRSVRVWAHSSGVSLSGVTLALTRISVVQSRFR